MARAEKKPLDDFEVVLTLSKEEAVYLTRLAESVRGLGYLRGLNDSISSALRDVDGLSAPYTTVFRDRAPNLREDGL